MEALPETATMAVVSPDITPNCDAPSIPEAAAIETGCPIGSRIEVRWIGGDWFSGVVTEYDIVNDEHYVNYDDDDDEQYEDLKTVRWRFVEEPGVAPPDADANANADANVGASGAVHVDATPSPLWKDKDDDCFIDMRGGRKIAAVHDADAALNRATNGLIGMLPRSVKQAAEVIEKLRSQTGDCQMSALGRRLTGRDTAPKTAAAVHLMCEHMTEQVLSEDGYNAQCAVLQGLHAVCDAQAVHGAELDVLKARAQLSAAEDVVESMPYNEPRMYKAEQAVAECNATLQRLVCMHANSGDECSYAGTVSPLQPAAPKGSGTDAHVRHMERLTMLNHKLKEQSGREAAMQPSSVVCPNASLKSVTDQMDKEKARVEAAQAALDCGDAALAAAYKRAEQVADNQLQLLQIKLDGANSMLSSSCSCCRSLSKAEIIARQSSWQEKHTGWRRFYCRAFCGTDLLAYSSCLNRTNVGSAWHDCSLCGTTKSARSNGCPHSPMTNPKYAAHDDRSSTERCLELDTYDVQKAKGERYQADCKAHELAKARGEDMKGRKEPEPKDTKYGNCEGPPLVEGETLSYFGGSELHVTLGWVKRLLDDLEEAFKYIDQLIMATGGRATLEIIALDSELKALQLGIDGSKATLEVN